MKLKPPGRLAEPDDGGREQRKQRQRRYPSDLTDAQCEIVDPTLPLIKSPGRIPKPPSRAIVHAILPGVRSGRSWRQLPVDFPPWQTVSWQVQQGEKRRVTESILGDLREQPRIEGRPANRPTGRGRDPRPVATSRIPTHGTGRVHPTGREHQSAAMSDPRRAQAVLRTLHYRGIQLPIDDFGTGHSLLAYLQQLPVDELKIDRSFIRHITSDASTTVLTRTQSSSDTTSPTPS